MFEDLLSRHGLSLDRLHGFLSVAEAGNISRAAAGDPVKQSQLSRQIRDLEAFFGVELTHRRGKSIAISAEGLRLAALIRQHLRALDDFRLEQAGQMRTYSFGTTSSLMEWLVCPRMPELLKQFPNARLHLETWRSAELVSRVRDGRLDFALVRDNAVPEDQLRLKLARARYLLAVPVALARQGKLPERPRLEDVARLPLALQVAGGTFHHMVTEALLESGVTWEPVVACQSFLQVRAVVESGCCAGILPEFFTTRLDPRRFQLLPMAFLQPHVRTLVLHWSERQMQRRGIEESRIRELAAVLKSGMGI